MVIQQKCKGRVCYASSTDFNNQFTERPGYIKKVTKLFLTKQKNKQLQKGASN